MNNAASKIVLIHGLGNTASIWEAQRRALSRFGDVIVPDYRGSDSIAEMADSVLEQAGSSMMSLVGFSLGGYIAFNILSRFPDRVARLALISASPYADDETIKAQRQRLIDKASDDYEGLLHDMGRFIVNGDGLHAAQARQVLVEMGRDLGSAEFCRQQRATMERDDCRDLLGGIRLPTRILCGENDVVTPPAGNRYLADHIAGATIEVVGGAGHLLPLERPERVTAFLASWLSNGATAA